MDNQAWRDLIGKVPQKQHNKLAIMTYVGIEIAVQDLVRVQEDYLVIRGRLAGTSDAGRLFFIPFDQITYLGIMQLIREDELDEKFGAQRQEVAAAAETADQPTAEQPPPESESEPELEPEKVDELSAEPASQTTQTPVKFPNRAELLERIKNRKQKGQPLRHPLK